jgi:hypothetical protein
MTLLWTHNLEQGLHIPEFDAFRTYGVDQHQHRLNYTVAYHHLPEVYLSLSLSMRVLRPYAQPFNLQIWNSSPKATGENRGTATF